MRIGEIYGQEAPGISIEVFPPKTSVGDASLFRTLDRLSVYRPVFVSCTYGAGGSTRNRTIELCEQIQKQYHLTATAHFTCVGSTREELVDWLGLARDHGIKNIMALRGDPPGGNETFQSVDGGLGHANELVTLIRERFPGMGIGVAGYPEKHQEASDPHVDLENLKRKVDAGADAVFTQLFFVNDYFFEFRDRYKSAGIDVPLIPGIMPITEFARIKRITSMCGVAMPDELSTRLEAVQNDRAAQFEIGVDFAIRQCRELIDRGAPGIHFYALNRSRACEKILEALGHTPQAAGD